MQHKTLNHFLRIPLIIIISLMLSACSSTSTEPVIEDVKPEAELYASAMVKLEDGNYRPAIADLEAMEARYPYGRYSEQAQLELVYATIAAASPQLQKQQLLVLSVYIQTTNTWTMHTI